MRKHSRLAYRRGIFLVDSLFSGMGVLILLALLLPAVQQAREAARRAQCQNQLHSLAIAIYDYDVVYKCFPPGWVHQKAQRSNFGWGRAVLPFVEQLHLYRQIDGDYSLAEALADEKLFKLMQTNVSVFRCPSDPMPDINQEHVPIDIKDRKRPVATSNYVGANGSGDWSSGKKLRGVFGENSSTRMSDIRDGTSNTILFGERSGHVVRGRKQRRADCNAAIIYGVSGDGKSISQQFTLFIGRGGLNSTEVTTKQQPAECSLGISSPHPGGAQVTLADSRVVFLSENIDPAVYDYLLTKAGNEKMNVP